MISLNCNFAKYVTPKGKTKKIDVTKESRCIIYDEKY